MARKQRKLTVVGTVGYPGGPVVLRKLKALSDATGPRGVWMRDAGHNPYGTREVPGTAHPKPKTRLQAGLNACAHRVVVYDYDTVMVRKAGK